MASPSFFFHEMMLPWVMVGDSAGSPTSVWEGRSAAAANWRSAVRLDARLRLPVARQAGRPAAAAAVPATALRPAAVQPLARTLYLARELWHAALRGAAAASLAAAARSRRAPSCGRRRRSDMATWECWRAAKPRSGRLQQSDRA